MTASLPAATLLLSPQGAALGQALKATATWRTSAVTLTRRPRRLPTRNYLSPVRHTTVPAPRLRRCERRRPRSSSCRDRCGRARGAIETLALPAQRVPLRLSVDASSLSSRAGASWTMLRAPAFNGRREVRDHG